MISLVAEVMASDPSWPASETVWRFAAERVIFLYAHDILSWLCLEIAVVDAYSEDHQDIGPLDSERIADALAARLRAEGIPVPDDKPRTAEGPTAAWWLDTHGREW